MCLGTNGNADHATSIHRYLLILNSGGWDCKTITHSNSLRLNSKIVSVQFILCVLFIYIFEFRYQIKLRLDRSKNIVNNWTSKISVKYGKYWG